MDYRLNPIIMIICYSKAAMNFVPGIPYSMCVVFFFPASTDPSLCGIKNSARMNAVLATLMAIVIAIFFAFAARYMVGHPHHGIASLTLPFYDSDSASFKTSAVLGGTSIAVLIYIGFDGVSTLSEGAENPASIFSWQRS